MYLKLVLRYLVIWGSLILIASQLLCKLILDIDFNNEQYVFLLLFIVAHSLVDPYMHLRAGKKIGISMDNEYYLKTNFSEIIESKLSADSLQKRIEDSADYLGKVHLNKSVIKKQKVRGLRGLSQSFIEFESNEEKLRVKLSTSPVLSIIKVDNYINYKCFILLKNIITNE